MMSEWKIIEHEILDSTNLEARRLVDAESARTQFQQCGASWHCDAFRHCGEVVSGQVEGQRLPDYANTVILAREQTAGRGRRGRAWNSPKGENLYFSMVLCPKLSAEECASLTLVTGLAVAESVRVLTGTDAMIKWPNDIVVEGKKVCGILSELVLDGTFPKAVIVGVGVNVGERTFPPELLATATSLEQQCGRKISASALLEEILKRFEMHYRVFCRERTMHTLREAYNELLVNRDRPVCVLEPTGDYRGVARGVNEQGELLVELPDGHVKAVYAGEVSVRGIYGYV